MFGKSAGVMTVIDEIMKMFEHMNDEQKSKFIEFLESEILRILQASVELEDYSGQQK